MNHIKTQWSFTRYWLSQGLFAGPWIVFTFLLLGWADRSWGNVGIYICIAFSLIILAFCLLFGKDYYNRFPSKITATIGTIGWFAAVIFAYVFMYMHEPNLRPAQSKKSISSNPSERGNRPAPESTPANQ